MTQQFGKHVFDQASKLFKDAAVRKKFPAAAKKKYHRDVSKGFCDQATASGLEQTKVQQTCACPTCSRRC